MFIYNQPVGRIVSKIHTHTEVFFFFFGVGSHHPLIKKWLGDYAARLGDLQSHVE